MLNERYPGSSSRHDENSWLLHTRKCRELLTLLSLSEWKLSSKGARTIGHEICYQVSCHWGSLFCILNYATFYSIKSSCVLVFAVPFYLNFPFSYILCCISLFVHLAARMWHVVQSNRNIKRQRQSRGTPCSMMKLSDCELVCVRLFPLTSQG